MPFVERFRRLAIASTAATLLLVTIGGLVRATKSGLGCGTDWPHCSGQLLPAIEGRAVAIEFTHRLAAGAVVVLLGALAWSAWRRLPHRRDLRMAALGAFGLVLFQALLGALVVKLELEAVSVVLHLATAMALLGLLVYITLAATEDRRPDTAGVDANLSRRAYLAAGSVLVLLMVGSYVSGRQGAALAFGDWPLMGGRLVPDLSAEPAALHFLHRALAAVVGVVVAVVTLGVIRRNDLPFLQVRLAHSALGLYVVQVLIGAANVWTRLNELVVTMHLFVGAVIWACLVALAVSARPLGAPDLRRKGVRGAEPVLDSGR